MVAFAKPHLKPHTRCGSAKDSGRRYYSPEISRWLSRDPIGEEASRSQYFQSMFSTRLEGPFSNDADFYLLLAEIEALRQEESAPAYAFVRNAPTLAHDPFGLNCSILVMVGHYTEWMKPWVKKNPKPGKCELWGPLSCWNDQVYALANQEWGLPATWQIPFWPYYGGFLYPAPQYAPGGVVTYPNVDLIYQAPKVVFALKKGFEKLCAAPCCCEKVTITVDCHKVELSLLESKLGPGDYWNKLITVHHVLPSQLKCGNTFTLKCAPQQILTYW